MKKKCKNFALMREGKKLLLAMKLTIVFFITGLLAVSANTYSQQTKLNLSLNDAGIVDVFREVEDQSEFFFFFNSEELDVNKKMNIELSNASIEEVMGEVLAGSKLKYKIVDRYIVISADENGNANFLANQELEITGVVTDKSGQPMPGVTVIVKGTTIGTTTDMDGKYTLSNVTGNAQLVFSFIGMISQEIDVAGQSRIDVSLSEDTVGLDEVVVVGYGTQRKKDLTGAVSSVGTEDFELQPITEVDQILQGRSAGVVVTSSSGAPGTPARIRIRGANSINGSNEPLYVIDGFVGADYGSINPNDIENIQVLKDASSTAIYGSRGSNGVVLITTRSGKKGEGKISFRSTFSLSEVIKRWDLLEAGDYAETANAYNIARGTSPVFTDQEIAGYKANGGTDWQDEVFQTAVGQDYQLDYSGGTDKATYFVSGNYIDQEGIVMSSEFKRFGLRANVSSNITDNLKAQIKTSFSRRENTNTQDIGASRGPLGGMVGWAPTTPARDSEGNITISDPVGSLFENPLEFLTNEYLTVNNAYSANGGLTYTIIPGLTAEVNFGANFADINGRTFVQGLKSGGNSIRRNSTETIYLQNTNIITYKRAFGEDHQLTVTAASEAQKFESNFMQVDGDNLNFPTLGYNNLTQVETITAQSRYAEASIMSYIGRVNYQFKGRYMFTASLRTDGSSKFAEGNKWATFPSGAFAWQISEEGFMEDSFIENLKLRTSWGKTGNQAIDAFGTVSGFDLTTRESSTSFENGVITSGAILGNPGNKDLKWETTEQINIGIDASILNNGISFTADYFKKNTTDLHIREPLPRYVGGGTIFKNIGEVQNSGVEFSVNALVIDKPDFSWTSSLNASFLKNEVIDIGDVDEIPMDSDSGEGSTEFYENIIRPGHSISSFYGLTYLGTWKSDEAAAAAAYGNVPGDARYLDVNSDNVIDVEDADIIGNGIPKGMFGWNNTLKYKNFTMNVFFQALTGFDRLNLTYGRMITPGLGPRHVTHVDILDRWDANTNPDSDIPHFSSTSYGTVLSDRFVENASFLRLKNLSFSYDLPVKNGRRVTLMLSGTNLLTFTKYKGLDPEAYASNGNVNNGNGGSAGVTTGIPRPNQVGSDTQGADMGAYPNSKMYSFSVNINF